MTDPRSLHLYEQIVLLALRDEEGTYVNSAWNTQALAGALLAELVLEGQLAPVDGGGKGGDELEVASEEPLGDPLLDECLRTVATAGKRRTMKAWLAKIASWKDLKPRAAESLCARGILRSDTDRVLLFFERQVWPEADPEPERALVERLRRVIFEDADDVDARTVVLLSLAWRTSILDAVFGKKELKARKQRLERVVNGEASGKAAKAVVEEVQAVVFLTTVIIPAVIMPVVMHHH